MYHSGVNLGWNDFLIGKNKVDGDDDDDDDDDDDNDDDADQDIFVDDSRSRYRTKLQRPPAYKSRDRVKMISMIDPTSKASNRKAKKS